ncbi:MAG TPA: type IV pilus twitching motility protein PilT [candidate division Zixibacteria bacterium]|nr:type IV pilus twitching motility protein PilT [candidate division Zixibacteria bacterium]MDD4918324.1 type IV pilus twitching motility protein PilT [candidate division Zixibacteria bacterium]MDM7974030.1 type IV pilus twitching motility protein PilT [candidate division Zixibacteria bacterium]HPM38341.1 type IV pilus twitching motility protein PilT [candidate division Zixibacteria bacterium]
MAKIDQLLNIVRDAHASDLHLAAGSVPIVRVSGRLEKTSHKRLTSETIKALVYEMLSDDQIRLFEREGDLDVAYGVPGGARFRINIFHMQCGVAAAIRLIPDRPPSLDSLGFADTVARLTEQRSGLILVTGPTNSGKTTTLAAMIDQINTGFARHILTLEDPIEYIHESKNSLVSQRQVGRHVGSFAAGLRAALREDPDVITVGELRDTETIAQAITAAETGLLVLGTLHTTSAAATVDRIVDVFPPDQQQQIRIMLADTLLGVVSQHLLTRADGPGRVLAYELLVRTPSVQNLIRESKTHQLSMIIQSSRKLGMRLLDNHLKALVDAGIIRPEEAVRVAHDPSPFLAKSEQPEEMVPAP